MQQQGEGTSDTQENSQPDMQEHISDDVTTEVSPSVIEKNDDKGTVLETPTTTANELDPENSINDNNEDSSSESPSTQSKTRQSTKKRNAKQENEDFESVEDEIQSELRQDNEVSGTENNEVTYTKDTIVDVPAVEDVQGYVVEEPEDRSALDTSEESGNQEYCELPAEDGKSESSLELVFVVETPVTASDSNDEICETKSQNTDEVSEKYSLSVSSSELHQFSPSYNDTENDEEHPLFNSENMSGSSWAGNIRSVSARRPMRKSVHCVTYERSSVSADRARTDENHSDTDCSVDTTESIFSSLKRKAREIDISCKKQKLNESKNSKFFSMVSSPLRMLKNKLSDRIVESPNALNAEVLANGSNEDDDDDESIDEKIQKENNETKEKSLCVVANDVSNQNKSLYQTWCSLM